MEEQKYFIPKIEDIRVGYECEKEDSIKGYEPYTFDLKGVRDVMQDEISDYREAWFRTSYLSKEQIEAEGWYFTQQIGNTLFFKKKDFELTFNNNYININNFGENDLGYWGQCKDINTFRYICKLLEI